VEAHERTQVGRSHKETAGESKMSKPNNQPAFPTNQYANGISPSGFDTGMELRDYMAAKSLPILMSFYEDMDGIAGAAYKMADAMLKAREA
jgi:hypothetical protein